MTVTWQVSNLQVHVALLQKSSSMVLTKHSVKPLSPVHEETENAGGTDKDLKNPLLMEHGLVDSVSTYHTHIHTARKLSAEVRYDIYSSFLNSVTKRIHVTVNCN